jgi:hypothetical protein
MTDRLTRWALAGVLASSLGATSARAQGNLLSHDVFFSLKDSSDGAKKKLVAACQKYLSGHEGTVFFTVGTRAGELDREVNDKAFHVSLHIVFDGKASQDKYQAHPRHLKFIEENKDNWETVRVFDSYVEKTPK